MFECDCRDSCKSAVHGEAVTSAISKRGVSDADLCAYLSCTCCRCESVVDSAGRCALHLAASCGRTELVRWLVNKRNANVNFKDQESGYTALHRSVFYGKIHVAVELMKLGASLSQTDSDGLTALDHAMYDGFKPTSDAGELYAWGSNNNNVFGTHESKKNPSVLDSFHKKYATARVKEICIDQFHMIIVTESGKAYSCGHGQGGRLGLGNEDSITTPQLVNLHRGRQKEVLCIQASISRDHSMFLGSNGSIYTCGLNKYSVLGYSSPSEKVLTPRAVRPLSKKIRKVIACQYHSLAWGPEGMYVWGLNAGQLGKKTTGNDSFIVTPKSLNVLTDMSLVGVAASNGATVFCTQKGDVYLLHEYACKKIGSKLLNIVQISVTGGKLDPSVLHEAVFKENEHDLKVAVLTNTGNVLVWQDSDPQLCRCIYNVTRAVNVKQMILNSKELLLVTDFGEAFRGVLKQRKRRNEGSAKNNDKSAFHKFLEKDECVWVTLQRFPKLQRAVFIQSDPKGKDYCVIQAYPYLHHFQDACSNESQINYSMDSLLTHANISDDNYDVTLQLKGKQFRAHRYVLAVECSYFEKLFSDSTVVDTIVLPDDVVPEIFEQLLRYVYTASCDLLKCGELKNRQLLRLCQTRQKSSGATRSPVRLLNEMAKRFGCTNLQESSSVLYMEQGTILSREERQVTILPRIVFDRLEFPNLYDITILCVDGKEVRAHKCILAARLEYFRNMFSMRWKENQTPQVTLPFPKSTVEIFLEYLYTDSVCKVNIDTHLKLLVLADHLFVNGLKEICEINLSKELTLKNAPQILSFAHLYNAETLKGRCKQFVVSNMTSFLEMGYLNELEEELLREISDYYYETKNVMWSRQLTPYSTAASDETILSISDKCPEALLQEKPLKVVQRKKTRTRRSYNLSTSENEEAEKSSNNLELSNSGGLESIMSEEVPQTRGFAADAHERSNLHHDSGFSFNKYSSDFPELGTSFGSDDGNHRTPVPKTPKFRTRMPPKIRHRLISENSDLSSTSPADLKSSPKSWKPLPDYNEQSSPPENFTVYDIMSEEKVQKLNLMKISNKLLQYTQMEDQAIFELDAFYNTQDTTDEIILVERVHVGTSAATVWVSNVK